MTKKQEAVLVLLDGTEMQKFHQNASQALPRNKTAIDSMLLGTPAVLVTQVRVAGEQPNDVIVAWLQQFLARQ